MQDPHHPITDVAMVGGGAYPQPGEISQAYYGVLFMDEQNQKERGILYGSPFLLREVSIKKND